MATFNRSDLEFILRQILMAEAGQPPVNPFLAFGLREVAGTNNSTVPGQAAFGSADLPFPQLTDQIFRLGYTAGTTPGSIVTDSSPRTISNLISDQTALNPAAVARAPWNWCGFSDETMPSDPNTSTRWSYP